MQQEEAQRELDAQTFVRMVGGGAAQLRANVQIVNDLNVFPIPDGDTGENMCLTINGGLHHIEQAETDDLAEAARCLADGMLRSARGNSGVILSQLFAGIADGLQGKKTANVYELADALHCGVEHAYAAVVTPTEGTILTVAREAAEYASVRLSEQSTLVSFGTDYMTELEASLRRTPELLDVLKQAGVIDSGGAGLYYIVDGAMRVVRGEKISSDSGAQSATVAQDGMPNIDAFDEHSTMEYGYCTKFLLQLLCSKCDPAVFSVDTLTEHLGALGDSIVALQTGTVVKVHIHTMTPGAVLAYCQHFGEFLTLKIENMTLQHHTTLVQNRFPSSVKTVAPFAIVTVAAGEGIRQTLLDLGADYVIDGGQGNNPSAQAFIEAFDAVHAQTIFVLPNNANILLAAKQAASLYEKAEVMVLPSCDIGQGYAALAMHSYDSADALHIAEEMTQAMQNVVTGSVTKAVRDARLDAVCIHTGDYIGFCGKSMLAAEPNCTDAALSLLGKMEPTTHDILIVVYGASMHAQQKEIFRAQAAAAYPALEIYEIDGKQPIYDFWLILQ